MPTGIIYGVRPVEEMLFHASERIQKLVVARGASGPRQREVQQLAQSMGIRVERRSRKELDSLAGGGQHQGVVLFARKKEALSLPGLLACLEGVEAPVLLVLDGITDPRNLGAIIRTAEVLGGSGVVMGRDRAAGLGPAAVKASAGATELVPVATVVNIPRALKSLKDAGFWVVGTAGEAEKRCFQYHWEGPTAVVLGAEGRGLRRLVRENCDQMVGIPLSGKITSLNAACAAAIIMYEIARQRES